MPVSEWHQQEVTSYLVSVDLAIDLMNTVVFCDIS